jgi:hypothetical protein
MKLFNSQNLLSASLCSLLGLLTLFAGSYPLVKAQSEPKLGCQATVDKIRKRSGGLKKKKDKPFPSSHKIRQLSKSHLHQNK